ncbi:MAG: hydantoinase B/oxoprolinase family protein [Bernardetiaceae bacterium]|nr:hydantoinase B/oxoprolinase family protein [Bernardetiaceae bacterium]
MWQIWIDTGGTFTDCIALSPQGERHRAKVLSQGALRGRVIRRLAQNRWEVQFPYLQNIFQDYQFRWLDGKNPQKAADPSPVRVVALHPRPGQGTAVLVLSHDWGEDLQGADFELTACEEAPILAARLVTGTPLGQPLPPCQMRLGTTKGTNALLERKIAPTALLITRGFADLLAIGDQQRPHLFALEVRKPAPLATHTLEVNERLDAQGRVVEPLTEAECDRIVAQLRPLGVTSVAIALMHSYLNPEPEQRLAAKIREAGWATVSASSALSPAIKLLPRAQTAVVNACLAPIISGYLGGITQHLPATGASPLLVMTSGGSLVSAPLFQPKDSLLSGPAGGVLGAARVAQLAGYQKVIGFDMGGTSTDVTRIDGQPDRRYETTVGEARILSPSLAIETVAAGGGSLCQFDGFKLVVGPHSAGATPGPACYGAGGDLTLTDVNLLAGRLLPDNFGIPLNLAAAEAALDRLIAQVNGASGETPRPEQRAQVLDGLLRIANEKMAEAVRKISVGQGYLPAEYPLLAFGGAGGQHACPLARLLGITTILVPYEAGLLSAYGMGQAAIERSAARQVLRPWAEAAAQLGHWLRPLVDQAQTELAAEGFTPAQSQVQSAQLFLRFRGQENTLAVDFSLLSFSKEKTIAVANNPSPKKLNNSLGNWRQMFDNQDKNAIDLSQYFIVKNHLYKKESQDVISPQTPVLEEEKSSHFLEITRLDFAQAVVAAFRAQYEKLFGHWPQNQVLELESLRLTAAAGQAPSVPPPALVPAYAPAPERTHAGHQVYTWERLRPGATLAGPALVLSQNCTVAVDAGWRFSLDAAQNAVLLAVDLEKETSQSAENQDDHSTAVAQAVQLELFTNRLRAIAEQMGELLRRTAFSVNVKERLDFSCALLDAQARLVVNAPHIPVHLGSLGVCARQMLAALPPPGDPEGWVAITNHPAYGGSHLPDVTLLAPVHYQGQLLGYVANRAHHAEIGGERPGSMPPQATQLAQEGVVIAPRYLVQNHEVKWPEISELLNSGPFPTRALAENLADLNAALAAIRAGQAGLQALGQQHGPALLRRQMARLEAHAAGCLRRSLGQHWPAEAPRSLAAEELLDDGHRLAVAITLDQAALANPASPGPGLIFRFQGTSPQHPGNLNANPAIVSSVVMYVLRLLIAKYLPEDDIPLNEGLLAQVRLDLPPGSLLHPAADPDHWPAVVGGNTETSQRLTDTLLKALGLAACSYGSMNNLLFGNAQFGYYETIGGGTGAGPGFAGADAVHQHMTNTRLTDPEVMELRYPVRLEQMAVRAHSGGAGAYPGGCGIRRVIRFLAPVSLSLLTQHRVVPPYGLAGGQPGALGQQYLLRANGQTEPLAGLAQAELLPGDQLVMLTPGGGGWGETA